MCSTPLGGEREHRHARFNIKKRLAVSGGSHSDFGKGLGIRIRVDSTVCKENDAVLTEEMIFSDHQKKGGDGFDACGRANGLESSFENVSRGV